MLVNSPPALRLRGVCIDSRRGNHKLPVRARRTGYSLDSMQQAVNKEAQKPPVATQRLTPNQVLDWLVEDKLVETAAAEQLKKERRYYRGALHPLVTVSDQKWKQLAPPHRPLGLEFLTEWLAKRVGMD